jgi:hypothetical protein
MTDHETIWLQHPDDAGSEGRLWCQHKVWPEHPEDHEPTEYVRADLYRELEALVKSFVLTDIDYMIKNRLGDPEKQHNIKWARSLGFHDTPVIVMKHTDIRA